MKTKMIIAIMAFLMAFNIQVQDPFEGMTKKKKRQAKRELKEKERAAYKTAGFELLKEKNFVLRVDRASNAKTGRMVTLPSLVNFVKIDGDDVTVQFGAVGDYLSND